MYFIIFCVKYHMEGKKNLSKFSLKYTENYNINNSKASTLEKLLHFSHATKSFLMDIRPSLP